jgi:uncharacterized protein YjaZ
MPRLQVSVSRSLDELRPHFLSAARPRDRFAQAQASLLVPDGLMAFERTGPGYDIRACVLRDGYSAVFGQQAWGLFDPRRTLAASDWQFTRFADLDVTAQCQGLLEQYAAGLEDVSIERITCTLLPIDPANPFELVADLGLSCFAAVPGQILLALWPSDGNLARLGPTLARALVQTIGWSHQPTTLGDVLRLEGRAAAFVAAQFPDDPAPWLAPFRPPPDHQATLDHVATLLGLDEYRQLEANVYGARVRVADLAMPTARPMEPDELAYARELIAASLDATEPCSIAAHLYGDELVAAQGHPSVGLPAYAGFEAGYRVVTAS